MRAILLPLVPATFRKGLASAFEWIRYLDTSRGSPLFFVSFRRNGVSEEGPAIKPVRRFIFETQRRGGAEGVNEKERSLPLLHLCVSKFQERTRYLFGMHT